MKLVWMSVSKAIYNVFKREDGKQQKQNAKKTETSTYSKKVLVWLDVANSNDKEEIGQIINDWDTEFEEIVFCLTTEKWKTKPKPSKTWSTCSSEQKCNEDKR